jgi:uncharacterized repeat protein (TIGR01451 family)
MTHRPALAAARRFLTALALLALPGVTSSAHAQQSAPAASALVVKAENRTAAAAAARGARRRDAQVRAGDVLRYTLTFTNTAGRPVREVALQNPVAAGLQFVGGSAAASRDDARAEFSADGGRSWSAQPTETVTIDGAAVTRPVAPERFTAVRWTVTGFVAPGATVVAHFDARLAAPSPTHDAAPAVPAAR